MNSLTLGLEINSPIWKQPTHFNRKEVFLKCDLHVSDVRETERKVDRRIKSICPIIFLKKKNIDILEYPLTASVVRY